MSDQHDQYSDWAAAYVLGALEPAERAVYERHLRTCETCQSDVNDLAAFPGLLAQIEPTIVVDTEAAARITARAVERAGHDYGRLEATSRRWQRAAVASAAAALVLVAAITVASLSSGGLDGTELAVDDQAGAWGSVRIDERLWGTSITLDVAGLEHRDTYQLWAVDTTGAWTAAATWRSTPEGLARLTGAAAVPTDEIDRIVITSTDPDDVLLTAQK